jgi:hypothetical protein
LRGSKVSALFCVSRQPPLLVLPPLLLLLLEQTG